MSCVYGRMDTCEVSQRKMMVEKKGNLWYKKFEEMGTTRLINHPLFIALEYDFTKNCVKIIYNVYLRHHPFV